MKNLKNFVLALAILAFAAACTEENVTPQGGGDVKTESNEGRF
jgi:hypothetical protein